MSELPSVINLDDEAGPSTPSSRPQSPSSRGLRRPASHGRLAKLMMPGRSRSGSNASQEAPPVIAYAEDISSSGRTTPEQRRRTGKAAASLLANDAKYKKFAVQVERALQSFESVNEWADFISFLSRLLKTFQGVHPPYNEIPRKLIVSKRLAQCLNPALPSGVHQRALDVYAYIFGIIGVDGLRRDLLIWSSGLFPFFQFAATSVRPHLLNIYETYYLPLGQDLRPAVKALTLALLPGLEEETGDFFDRVLSLLDKLSKSISSAFFISNLFLILISAPSARLSVLNYLAKRMLKPPDPTESSETGLLLRGTAAALGDENVLVRRNALDLLLRILKMDGELFRDADTKDQRLLMRATVATVLLREISLSRRVYTWLLGPAEGSEDQIAYYEKNGLDLLCQTLQEDMDSTSSGDSTESQRPFKVFLSLQDKWEVGSPLAGKLVIHALQRLRGAIASADAVGREELLLLVNAIHEAIEPSTIWRPLALAIKGDLSKVNSSEADLASWILSTISQHDQEFLEIHAPVLAEMLVAGVLNNPLDKECGYRAISIADALLRLIPHPLLVLSSPNAPSDNVSDFSQELYSPSAALTPDGWRERIRMQVIPGLLTEVFRLALEAAQTRSSDSPSVIKSLGMVSYLVDRDASIRQALPTHWTASLVEATSKASFPVLDAIATLLLQIIKSGSAAYALHANSTAIMLQVLLGHLRPEAAPYHVRAVELLWEYNQLAPVHTLENVVAAQMTMEINRRVGYDAFGTLWRHTDDSMLPGELFFDPLCLVLDALKSPDPVSQSLAETWMRNNMRSYFRALDPILARLLRAMEPKSPQYENLSLIAFWIDRVALLLRSGGQGLSKACHAMELDKSPHPDVQRGGSKSPGLTYTVVLVSTLTSLFERRGSGQTAQQLLRVQSSSIEALQLLISRGEIPIASLDALRHIVLDKLSAMISDRQLALQSKMLHLLHACLNAQNTAMKSHRKSASLTEIPQFNSSQGDFISHLVDVIIKALSAPSIRPILQHWIDFVLNVVNHMARRRDLLEMLGECFSLQLWAVMTQLRETYDGASDPDRASALTEAEPIMLLAGLERVITSLLAMPAERKSIESVRAAEGGSMIMGLVNGVFGAEGQPSSEKSASGEYLDSAINSLLITWSITADATSEDAVTSKTQIFARTRARTRKVLEKLFKASSVGAMASCIKVWATNSADVEDSALFECIDTLTPSAQRVVELVADFVLGKAKAGTYESSDPALLAFIEAYISRLEAPIALQIWQTMFSLTKDMLVGTSAATPKAQLYSLLRCMTKLAKTVATTSALEDRRLRRDLQDTYAKLLDMVTQIAGRLSAEMMFRRPPQRSASHPSELSEKADLNTGATDAVDAIYNFIAEEIIPSLRTFLLDNDRVAATCSGITLNIIVPAARQQKMSLPILRLLAAMSHIASAAKSWRTPIGEAFNDNKFFRLDLDVATEWKPLINALFESDKEKFPELLSRITAAPSANIFTNREAEMISRSLNLRRLSFVLLAAERNHYLAQLPSIQEKLVDILRTNIVSPRVHSEVYLCLRVLMCRVTPQHVANFWPVILAELLRVFENTMDDPPADGSEDLQLVLAACKFLDLLLVIQSEDFQVHQWMFVTDTTDAAFPPEDFAPEALVDCLNEIVREHLHDHKSNDYPPTSPFDTSLAALRKPRLANLHAVTSLQALQPFLARASIDTFEGVYSGSEVDWNAVEEGLMSEIFDMEFASGNSRVSTPRLT